MPTDEKQEKIKKSSACNLPCGGNGSMFFCKTLHVSQSLGASECGEQSLYKTSGPKDF